MNWYKTSQSVPIAISSYTPEYGELVVSFNGGKGYTYPGVSPFIYEKIRRLLSVKNYREVQNMLKNLSANREDTEEDKQQMLNQLYDEGYLK